MQLTVFLVEIILIFFYLQWEKAGYLIEPSQEQYSSYYSTDIIGNDILEFPNRMKENEKLSVLKESDLMEELVKYVPKIDIMSEIFRNGVNDESDFKEDFVSYMESLHFQYLGEEISIEIFRERLANPQNIHCVD
jgi:hypothetical protein